MTKSEINRAEYWQLVGLLVLAKRHNAILRDIRHAACEITGDVEDGHTGDAVYCDYSADELIDRLKIAIVGDPSAGTPPQGEP